MRRNRTLAVTRGGWAEKPGVGRCCSKARTDGLRKRRYDWEMPGGLCQRIVGDVNPVMARSKWLVLMWSWLKSAAMSFAMTRAARAVSLNFSNTRVLLSGYRAADLWGEQSVGEVCGADGCLQEAGPEGAGFVGLFAKRVTGTGEDECAVREVFGFRSSTPESDRDRLAECKSDGRFDSGVAHGEVVSADRVAADVLPERDDDETAGRKQQDLSRASRE
ncbi:MAG: hypothetical protein JWN19_814 [Arthrobacter sp.]|nr:hypothetical protein [Arthrobacter sp.]